MCEPFNSGARSVIALAGQEAQQLGSSGIGEEHLLLGILASKVLHKLGLRARDIRREVFKVADDH